LASQLGSQRRPDGFRVVRGKMVSRHAEGKVWQRAKALMYDGVIPLVGRGKKAL
jgi:hypothetical protein